jgi:hypothetical protein
MSYYKTMLLKTLIGILTIMCLLVSAVYVFSFQTPPPPPTITTQPTISACDVLYNTPHDSAPLPPPPPQFSGECVVTSTPTPEIVQTSAQLPVTAQPTATATPLIRATYIPPQVRWTKDK